MYNKVNDYYQYEAMPLSEIKMKFIILDTRYQSSCWTTSWTLAIYSDLKAKERKRPFW